MPITISLFSPFSFDGSAAQPSDWLRAIASGTNRYTVKTAAANEVVLTATADSGYAGYTLAFTPVTTFTPTPGGPAPMTGAIKEVSLYDASGALVGVIEGLPSDMTFANLLDASVFGASGVEISGSSGADSITGYTGSDTLEGGDGADVLSGGLGSGNDLLAGGAGADTMTGGLGDDVFIGGDGVDFIDGGEGDDGAYLAPTTGGVEVWLNQPTLPGQFGVVNVEVVLTGNGDNRIHGGATADYVISGAGKDLLEGAGGDDALWAEGGDDTVQGGSGDDYLDGGPGADRIDGGSGFDITDYSYAEGSLTVDLRLAAAQQTGFGLDVLVSVEGVIGSEYADTLTGDATGNYFDGWEGDNLIDGGDGDDEIYGWLGADRLNGGAGADYIADDGGSNVLRGGAGNDEIWGGVNFDDAHGNEGDDTVHGGLGDDWTVGGKDNDSLFGDEGSDVAYGNLGNDTCEGGSGADVVRGGQGDDLLTGGQGDDWLSGDRGNDTLNGGAGADTFNSFGDAGLDRVAEFSRADGDKVRLEPGSTYTVAQVGADTVISIGGGAQLLLVGVQMSTLGEGWIYVA